jgi:membrane protein DedA with SNARE-associated domain
MNGAEIFEFFLTQIIVFGPLMLGGVLFLAALGIPLPATIFVLAGGAFCRQGLLDCRGALLFGLLGAVGGDTASYFLGRLAKDWVGKKFAASPSWSSSRTYFNKRGGLAVFFTRWLVTPLALPTNLIAGSGGYAYSRFLLADVLGESFWLLLYGGMGFVLGGNWEAVSGLVGDMGGFLAGLVLLGLGIFLLRKRLAGFRKKRHEREAAKLSG